MTIVSGGGLRVLRLIGSLKRTGGGPVAALLDGCRALTERGHAVELASLDAPDHDCLHGLPFPANGLGRKRQGIYAYNRRIARWLSAHASRFDIAIVDGCWQYHGLALHRAWSGRLPYILYPHGMLDPTVCRRDARSRLSKLAYWTLSESRIVRDAQRVVFTAGAEAAGSATSFPGWRARALVLPLGIADAPPPSDDEAAALGAACPGLGDAEYILFLGRLHPIKALDLLVDAFATELAPTGVHLVLAGPDEAGLSEALRRRPAAASCRERIHLPGPLYGAAKWGALRRAAAVALVSHHENFGISAVEGLACGRPLLLSDQVMIAEQIAAAGAALVGRADAAGIAALLRTWRGVAAAGRCALAAAARPCYLRNYSLDIMSGRLDTLLRTCHREFRVRRGLG